MQYSLWVYCAVNMRSGTCFIISVHTRDLASPSFSSSGLYLSNMGLSLRECRLPALMIASILYGFNVVTFCLSLQRLFGGRGDRKRGRDINFPLAAVVIVLFMSSTTSLALHLTLVMREYMFLSQSSPHPEEFERKRRTIVVAKVCALVYYVVCSVASIDVGPY